MDVKHNRTFQPITMSQKINKLFHKYVNMYNLCKIYSYILQKYPFDYKSIDQDIVIYCT